MIMFDKIKPLKIYKVETFLPTLEDNKKRGSVITMLSPSYEASKFLMNNPLFINRKRYESYYLDRDVSFLIGNKKLEEIEESYINEAKRSELPDSAFGLSDERKYPLESEKHVKSAIHLFGHCPDSKKKQLAKRIASRAKEYGIKIPETTQVYKYLHEEFINESGGEKIIEKIINNPETTGKVYFWTSDEGKENSIVQIKKSGEKCRGRSELLIIKNDKIFLLKNDHGLCSEGANMVYNIPGGGWDPGEEHYMSALREAKEEARIIAEEPIYAASYAIVYKEPHKWIQEKVPKNKQWRGYYSEVYIAKYKSKYTGNIDELDKDDEMIKNGKFYNIKDVYDDLNPVHKIAIDKYFGKSESFVNEDVDFIIET